jgi:hypothetical protein
MIFSDKERAMFNALGFDNSYLDAVGMHAYWQAVGDCFGNASTGKAVDSLRRCYKAICDCNPYRQTPEFEALIQL